MIKPASLILLFTFIISPVLAGDYKVPDNMTTEEYAQARVYGVKHEECMTEYSLEQIQQQADARVVADHAMKHCVLVLEELHNLIVSWGYPPEFGSYYVSGISNRNANRILRNIMRFMAMPR